MFVLCHDAKCNSGNYFHNYHKALASSDHPPPTTIFSILQVSVLNFRNSWEEMGSDNEVTENFSLSFRGLRDAVLGVVDVLGMQPCNGTHIVNANADPKKPYMIHLSGVFIGNVSVLARAQVKIGGESGGALLRIAVRSQDPNISQVVADCIH